MNFHTTGTIGLLERTAQVSESKWRFNEGISFTQQPLVKLEACALSRLKRL
jgi:hypothetical protein